MALSPTMSRSRSTTYLRVRTWHSATATTNACICNKTLLSSAGPLRPCSILVSATTDRAMKSSKSCARAALGVTATAAILGATVIGCDSGRDYGSHDYSDLLLPGPIRLDPAHEFTSSSVVPDPGGKPGVSATFTSWDRTLVATVLVLPSASAASGALNQAKADLPKTVTGASAESVPVGSGGTVVSGTSPDGSKSVSVLLFTEGKTFTTYEISSDPRDPVSTDFLVPVGQKQDARIKASNVP
jgi:hypothetical protein